MRLVKSSILNQIEALAEAGAQLRALPQNIVVVITKEAKDNSNPTYAVYAALGGLVNGQIAES